MKRKYKIISICALCAALIALLVLMFWSHEYENGLTLRQNRFYAEFFALETNQDLSARRLTEPIEFFATERTEEIVAGMWYFSADSPRMGVENAQDAFDAWREQDTFLNFLQRVFHGVADEPTQLRDIWWGNITVERVVDEPQSIFPYVTHLPEWFLNNVRAMVGELTLKDYMHYVIYFDLTDELDAFLLDWADHPIAPTGDTELILELMNQLLWGELNLAPHYQELDHFVNNRWLRDSFGWSHTYFGDVLLDARIIANTHGFSAENQITVEWVWENPRLALEFARDLPVAFSRFVQIHPLLSPYHDRGKYSMPLAERNMLRAFVGGPMSDWEVIMMGNILFMHGNHRWGR